MILVAGGDSFTWGSDLADSPHGGPNGHSHSTYPALLAKYSDMKYVCAAYPGNANNAISRMAIDALCKYDNNAFLLVTWTYPQRAEFRFGDHWESLTSWHTLQRDFSQIYFKHVGNSEYYELYSVLKEILFLQSYCQVRNVPFLFVSANNTFYQHENYFRSRDSTIENLYNAIDWQKWFWFPPGVEANETTSPRGFYQWAIENKYKVSQPGGHPLEQAHIDSANLIREKFNEMVAQYN